MLPRKRRISKTVFSQLGRGRSYHSPFLTLRVHKKESCDGEATTFSFVTSRKVSNKAPQRNVLRRRGYAAVKKVIEKTQPCFVCVFYFKKEALTVSYTDIEKTVIQLLQQAHVISNHHT